MTDLEEILKCLCFVILGYFVAMIFSRMCSRGNGYKNGFSIGGDQFCDDPNHACNSCKNQRFCHHDNTCEWKNSKCIPICDNCDDAFPKCDERHKCVKNNACKWNDDDTCSAIIEE